MKRTINEAREQAVYNSVTDGFMAARIKLSKMVTNREFDAREFDAVLSDVGHRAAMAAIEAMKSNQNEAS